MVPFLFRLLVVPCLGFIFAVAFVAVIISVCMAVLSFLQGSSPSSETLNAIIYWNVHYSAPLVLIVVNFLIPFFSSNTKLGHSRIYSLILIVLHAITASHFKASWPLGALVLLWCIVVYSAGLLGTYTAAIRSEEFKHSKKQTLKHTLRSYKLSKRELDIVQEILAGKSNKAIAKALFIEEGTVKKHLKSVFKKLAISSRLEIATLITSLQEKK